MDFSKIELVHALACAIGTNGYYNNPGFVDGFACALSLMFGSAESDRMYNAAAALAAEWRATV